MKATKKVSKKSAEVSSAAAIAAPTTTIVPPTLLTLASAFRDAVNGAEASARAFGAELAKEFPTKGVGKRRVPEEAEAIILQTAGIGPDRLRALLAFGDRVNAGFPGSETEAREESRKQNAAKRVKNPRKKKTGRIADPKKAAQSIASILRAFPEWMPIVTLAIAIRKKTA